MSAQASPLSVELELFTFDRKRRADARFTNPEFKPEWGEHIAQFWIKSSDGREKVFAIEPPMPHLTVWRWAEFDVTATFDGWRLSPDGRGWWKVEWAPNTPCFGDWEWASQSTLHSTLWKRSRIQCARKTHHRASNQSGFTDESPTDLVRQSPQCINTRNVEGC